MLYIALIALVAGAFGACTNEFEPGPQATGPQVSFAATNPTSVGFTGAAEENTQKLTLARVDAKEELTVLVISEIKKEDATLFTIPETVTFAAGEETAELVYTVDQASMQNDVTYTVSFYLDPEVTTPYGYADWTVTYTLNPWELMKDSKNNDAKGKFRGAAAFDGFWSGVENLGVDIDVNIYQHKNLKQYKIEDPWVLAYTLGLGAETPEDLTSQFSWTNADLIVDYTDPNNVKIPAQSIGISENYYGYGEGYIQAAGGTLVDGIITFPVEGIGFAHLAATNGQLIPCNTSGMFRIVLPGVEISDYSLAVAYDGMDVAADNTTTTAKLKFTYGDDVTGIKYMVVEGNVESDPTAALNTLLAGTDENILSVEDFVKGGKEIGVKVGMERGIYSIVAAPADKNGALNSKNAVVMSFYFAGIGAAEEHPCELEVVTAKFSQIYPAYAEQYPDYSAFAYGVFGTEIKAGKYLVAATATFEYYLAQGATLEALVEANGKALPVEQVNSENGWVSNAIGLDPDTEYMVVIVAENNYGETGTFYAAHTTDPVPYSGELAIGSYDMYCKASDTMESACTFTVEPTAGSDTAFLVGDIAMTGSGIKWHATYDPTASTLTLNGIEYGYEDYGNQFGALYGYTDSTKQYAFGFYSFANESSKGTDPLVLTVDPTTKQVNGMQNYMFAIPVFDYASGSQVGMMAAYLGASTTIAPHVESSSVKSVSMPFSSIKMRSTSKFTVKSANLGSANFFATKSVSSVKPIVVESYTREVVKFQPVKANIR